MSMLPNLCFENKHKSQSNRWRKTTIGGLGKFIGGGTPDTANPSYWNGFFPWVSSQDIAEGSIEQPHITKHISEEALRSSATQIVPKDAVMIVTRVGVGKVSIAPRNICTSQDFTNLVLKDANPVFVAHLLLSKKPEIMAMAQGTSIKGISLGDLKDIEVHLPDLSEQQKIADALSAMDEKISSLRENEGALVRFKVGLMQKLFSQELRFQQDDGDDFPDWDAKRLGDVFAYEQPGPYLVSSTNYSRVFATPVLTAGKTFILGYTDETTGVYKVIEPVVLFDDFTTATKLINFDFKIKSSAAKILTLACPGEMGWAYACLQSLNYTPQAHQRHWISVFQDIEIPWPSLDEQKKIVGCLSAMDAKIAAVGKEIALMEAFKQGLLQQMFV